jgi:hypothetical protein
MADTYQHKSGVYPTLPTIDPEVRDPHDINKHLRVGE